MSAYNFIIEAMTYDGSYDEETARKMLDELLAEEYIRGYKVGAALWRPLTVPIDAPVLDEKFGTVPVWPQTDPVVSP